MDTSIPPIRFPEGIIPVYARIKGPKRTSTIKLALDTGATYTMIPQRKIILTGHKLPLPEQKRVQISTASSIEYVPLVCINALDGLLGLNFLAHLPAFVEFYQKIRL